MRSLSIYCIVRCREPRTFETLGMGERGDVVHTIDFEDLAAVASNSPEARYDNTRRNMMAHMRVLDEVMAEHTVLPVRFDSVAPGPDAVREQLLKARYRELSSMLDGMEGRIEMGFKAFGTKTSSSRKSFRTIRPSAACAKAWRVVSSKRPIMIGFASANSSRPN